MAAPSSPPPLPQPGSQGPAITLGHVIGPTITRSRSAERRRRPASKGASPKPAPTPLYAGIDSQRQSQPSAFSRTSPLVHEPQPLHQQQQPLPHRPVHANVVSASQSVQLGEADFVRELTGSISAQVMLAVHKKLLALETDREAALADIWAELHRFEGAHKAATAGATVAVKELEVWVKTELYETTQAVDEQFEALRTAKCATSEEVRAELSVVRDGLIQRLTSLDRRVSSHAEAAQAQLQDFSDRHTRALGLIEDLTRRVQVLEDASAAQTHAGTMVADHVRSLDAAVRDGLRAAGDQALGLSRAVDARFAAVNDKLQHLDTENGLRGASIQDLSGKIEAVNAHVTSLNARAESSARAAGVTAELSDRLASLQEQVKTLVIQVQATSGRLDSYTSNLSRVEEHAAIWTKTVTSPPVAVPEAAARAPTVAMSPPTVHRTPLSSAVPPKAATASPSPPVVAVSLHGHPHVVASLASPPAPPPARSLLLSSPFASPEPEKRALTAFMLRYAATFGDKVAFMSAPRAPTSPPRRGGAGSRIPKPKSTAAVMDGPYVTFRDLDSHIRNLAAALHRVGFRKGGIAAIVAPNHPKFLVVTHAVIALGAIAAPVSPGYSLNQLTEALRALRPQIVVAAPSCADEVVAALERGRLASQVILLEPSANSQHPFTTIDALVTAGASSVPEAVKISPKKDPAVVLCVPRSAPAEDGSTLRFLLFTHANMVACLQTAMASVVPSYAQASDRSLPLPAVSFTGENVLCEASFASPAGFVWGLHAPVLLGATSICASGVTLDTAGEATVATQLSDIIDAAKASVIVLSRPLPSLIAAHGPALRQVVYVVSTATLPSLTSTPRTMDDAVPVFQVTGPAECCCTALGFHLNAHSAELETRILGTLLPQVSGSLEADGSLCIGCPFNARAEISVTAGVVPTVLNAAGQQATGLRAKLLDNYTLVLA